MAMNDDFENLIEKWRGLSLTWKVLLCTMMILQITSLASIADAIYEFKGFIVSGIEFYRFVTRPILNFFTFINISIKRETLDVITWYAMFFGALFRSLIAGESLPKNMQNWVYFILGLALFLLSTSAFYKAATSISEGFNYLDLTIIFLGIIGIIWGTDKWRYGTGSWPVFRKTIAMASIFFFIPIVFISLIAAISEGWVRI